MNPVDYFKSNKIMKVKRNNEYNKEYSVNLKLRYAFEMRTSTVEPEKDGSTVKNVKMAV